MKTTSSIKAMAAGLALIAGISSAFAQTDNTKRILPEFNSIVIDSPLDVKLNQGAETSVISNDGSLSDKLTTEVKDNVLYIKGKPENDITINFIKLNKIELLSSCDVKSMNQISSDKLEVFLTGASSEVNLDLNVKELNSTISGAGDITYKGTADSHTLVIKGAGDVNAYNLETKSTDIEISGAGDAKVNASQDLTGVINGAGDVKYLKEPANKKDLKVNGFGSYSLKGESGSDVNDTTKLKFGNKKLLFVDDKNDSLKHKDHKKDFNVYWAGVGLGVNGYLNAKNEAKTPVGYDFLDLDYAKSLNVAINFWEQKIPLWKRHINIVTGMGFDISNYRFTGNYSKLAADSDLVSAVYDSSLSYKKNKLVATYLNVPLLLQFDTDPFGKNRKTVHLSAGLVGGVRIGSHTKQMYFVNDVKDHSKTHDDFNLNPFSYSAMVRVGVGKIDLYATYALSEMFRKGEGPQIYPFTVGITLAGF